MSKLRFHPSYRVSLVPGEGVFWASADDVFVLEHPIYAKAAALIARRSSFDAVATAVGADIGLAPACFLLDELLERGLIIEQHEPIPRPATDAHVARIVRRLVGLEPVRVVVSSNPLDGRFATLDRRAQRDGLSWLLIDPSAQSKTLGALFMGGETGCWECLAFRLRRLQPAVAYLQQRGATTLALPARVAVSTVELELAARSEAQLVVRRPGCPSCGDTRYVQSRRDAPPELHRTIENRRPSSLINSINGVADAVKFVRATHPQPACVFVATPVGDGATSDLASLRRVMTTGAMGSGTTRRAALRAVIGEAVERHCGIAYGDEQDVRTTLAQLGGDAIAPNDCMLFSASQYATRAKANRSDEPATRVPLPLGESTRIDWTAVWSILTGTRRYLPTAYVVRGAHSALGRKYCVADTNGCAAGKTLGDAIVRGFLELVERDAIALWWYNRLHVPRIAGFADLATPARQSWLLDLTTDLGIPVVAAVSRRVDTLTERLVFGFGAAWDTERATRHAVREMTQMATLADRIPDSTLTEPRLLCEWLRTATAERERFVCGSASGPRSLANTTSTPMPRDPSQAAMHCAELVARRGLELLVFDQTRADVGFPVARVVVPGLRPAVPRFAPGRLFEVWREHPHSEGFPPRSVGTAAAVEAALNPRPFIF